MAKIYRGCHGLFKITIKEYSTRLNIVGRYARGVANSIDKGKIETFINGLSKDITKDVIMGDYTPSSYLEALDEA